MQHGQFEALLIDIADFHLPVYDEPEHPIHQNYRHEHTRRWAASVNAADAYVFVTPEYNHGPPPPLLNALDYVYKEWNYKPAGIVSYGGISGGVRAAQMEKLTLTTLKMMPMFEAVAIQNVSGYFDDQENFSAGRSSQELGYCIAERTSKMGSGPANNEALIKARLARHILQTKPLHPLVTTCHLDLLSYSYAPNWRFARALARASSDIGNSARRGACSGEQR